MSNANISPVIALAATNALKKGIDAKNARNETAPGVYKDIEVKLTIKVDEMRVAPDTDKAPTASIPLLTTCALLLQRFSPNDREKALEIFRDVMTTAMDMGKDQQKTLLADTGVADLEKTLKQEIIAKLPRVPVKGAVSIKAEDVSVLVTGMTWDED
jgi:hypothetical protein